METYTHCSFTFQLEITSSGVAIVDYRTDTWFSGNLERAGLILKEGNWNQGSYASREAAIAAIHAALKGCSWYACQEKEHSYVWFEEGIGMWNQSSGWGASTSTSPTAKAKVFDWEGIQQFPISRRFVNCGGLD